MDDREIACGKVPVQAGYVGAHVESVVCRERPGIDARSGDHEHPQSVDGRRRGRVALDDAPQQIHADT